MKKIRGKKHYKMQAVTFLPKFAQIIFSEYSILNKPYVLQNKRKDE